MRRELIAFAIVIFTLAGLIEPISGEDPSVVSLSGVWFAGLIYLLGVISTILLLITSKRILLITAYWLLTGSLGLLGFYCGIVGVYLESKTAATTGLYMIIIGTGIMALSGVMATIASNQQQKDCAILHHCLMKNAMNNFMGEIKETHQKETK